MFDKNYDKHYDKHHDKQHDNKHYDKHKDSGSKSEDSSNKNKPYYPSSKDSYSYESIKKDVNSVLPISKNKPQKPKSIKKAVVKVPVVLGEATVQIDMSAKIHFPEPVLEIKAVKKNLKLTQCRLLLPTNKLFIKGFVRKNIQYASPRSSYRHGVISSIRSLTVDVPFETVTEIDFINLPQFSKNPDRHEFTYFAKNDLPKGFSDKEHLLSADLSQFDQISGEVFNELPFCELLSSHFIEYDEALDREMGKVYGKDDEWVDAPFEEGTFKKIEEKMVLELTFKVLQKQQVEIDGHDHKHKGKDWEY
ncbi:CsxC family protein [Neobacillus sp. LXY-4]|uniref:CsxC family protein n=1 Tax=Neobacillus sp. LXY-4 TaxID=3379826 RepID=UPI003EE384AA